MRLLTSLVVLVPLAAVVPLAACAPDYSPNTYGSAAVQQANKVDTGIVIGFREVKISDDGSVGAVTGGAAGGILGAESEADVLPRALTALGGTVVGGLVGNTLQHATGDTTGWEYVVREPKGDLVSVTQREPTPIPIGQKVLVIEGKQARIVPDYATAAAGQPPDAAAGNAAAATKEPAEPSPPPAADTAPPPPATATAAPPPAASPPAANAASTTSATAAPALTAPPADPPPAPPSPPSAPAPSDGGASAPSMPPS